MALPSWLNSCRTERKQPVVSSIVFQIQAALQEEAPAELYRLLRRYYLSNGLYDELKAALYEQGIQIEAMKPLRNPAHRIVEFYVDTIWPGSLPEALPIETQNNEIVEPIQQVWQWSNWNANKQVAARWLALYGDLFIKVVQSQDRQQVYFQLIEPEYVTDFDTDQRGYLTWVRVDIPQVRRDGDKIRQFTHTEVWSKTEGTFRRWEHTRGIRPLEQLGTPTEEQPLSAFGIDFVPFVHAKLRDIGEPRGLGAFVPSLDKIDEANRAATRLHQMLFRHNKALWALSANAMDKSGRPLPPPQIPGAQGMTGTLSLGDDEVIALPGMASLEPLVPNLKYADALSILQDHMTELERDQPELTYARIAELGGNLSGRAIRLLLMRAISRAYEARGNAEAALIRANQMALTIGADAGLFGEIGNYERGDFEHRFAHRDILPLDGIEAAQEEEIEARAKLLRIQLGVSQQQVLRELGYTEQEITQFGQERETATAQLGEQLLDQFERGR